MPTKKGLGKGLDALLFDNSTKPDEANGPIRTVPLHSVEPNRNQPRKYFDKDALQVLAESIAQNGLLQPPVVREFEPGRYQIISGERRWRACRMAGLQEIPVVVRTEDDRAALELGLIENLQREDLNAVEEAKGYRALSEEYGLSQEQIAAKVGKSRPAISNAMRILALPESILALVLSGAISSGHARTLLPLCEKATESEILAIAEAVKEKDLSVRDLEQLVRTQLNRKKPKQAKKKDLYLTELESDLTRSFGRKVKISAPDGKKRGKIELEYYNVDDLNTLVALLAPQEGE